MKKRLMSAFLCLVTLLMLVLTSCGEETDIMEKVAQAEAEGCVTLSMWVVSDQKVDAAIAAEVSAAINSLTQAKYKVNLAINYLTGDEYRAKLYAAIDAYSETYDPKAFGAASVTKGDDNLYVTNYPELLKNQVDIVYIGDLYDANGNLTTSGADMYKDMASKGWLASIGSYLNNDTAKKLREYMTPALLDIAGQDGLYAIPNNNVIGEYQYVMLNEELINRYAMDGHLKNGDIDGFHNAYVYQFLDMVMSDSDNDVKVLPIDATYEECMELLAYNWSIDPSTLKNSEGEFSVLGSLYQDYINTSRGDAAFAPESLFANEAFRNAYLKMGEYKFNGRPVFTDSPNPHSAAHEQTAVKFVSGDRTLLTEGENGIFYYTDENGVRYYAVSLFNPVVSNEDVFGDMFGVCAFNTGDRIATAMKIITYLNTDAEIRNLFQYGIEEEFYTMVEVGSEEDPYFVPHRTEKGEKYSMSPEACGNTFISMPEAWMDRDVWECAKDQNRDAVIPLITGFEITDASKIDAQAVAYIHTLNGEIKALLDGCRTYEELKALISDLAILLDTAKKPDASELTHEGLKALVAAKDLDVLYDTLCSSLSTSQVAGLYSPYGMYYQWAVSNKFIVEEKPATPSDSTTTESGDEAGTTEAPEA